MVDNFNLIIPLLKFEDNNFYFVQVLQRKKDHAEENKRLGRNNNARLIKAFYIYSIEQLLEYKEEIIALSKLFNARVGINLNPRNNRKVALEMMEQLAHCIKSENYNVAKLYNSCCGASLGTDKTWIVDIDAEEMEELETIVDDIEGLEPHDKEKLIARIPTKNGMHLITKAFNSKEFGDLYPKIEVHKNNPTVLYVP